MRLFSGHKIVFFALTAMGALIALGLVGCAGMYANPGPQPARVRVLLPLTTEPMPSALRPSAASPWPKMPGIRDYAKS